MPLIRKDEKNRHKTVHVLLGIAVISILQASSRLARDDGFCIVAEDTENYFATVVFFTMMAMVAYGTNAHVNMYAKQRDLGKVQFIRNVFTVIGFVCHVCAVGFTGKLWEKVNEAHSSSLCDMTNGDAHQAAWVVIVTLIVSLLIVISDFINELLGDNGGKNIETQTVDAQKRNNIETSPGDILLFTAFFFILMYVIAESNAGTGGKTHGAWEVLMYAVPIFYFGVSAFLVSAHRRQKAAAQIETEGQLQSRNKTQLEEFSPQTYEAHGAEWGLYIVLAIFLIWPLWQTWYALSEDMAAMPKNATASQTENSTYSGCIPNEKHYEDIMGLGLTVPGYLVFHIALITYTLHAYLRNGLVLMKGGIIKGTSLGVVFYRDCITDFNVPFVTLIVLGWSSVYTTGVPKVMVSGTIVDRLHIPPETVLINGTNVTDETTKNINSRCGQMNESLQQASSALFWAFVVVTLHAIGMGWLSSKRCPDKFKKIMKTADGRTVMKPAIEVDTEADKEFESGYSMNNNVLPSSDSQRMLRPTTRLNQHQTSTSDLSF